MEYEKIIELINDFGNSKLNNLKLDFPDGTKIDMSKNEEKVKIVENIEMPNSQRTLDDGKDYVQTKETIDENKSKKGKIKPALKKNPKLVCPTDSGRLMSSKKNTHLKNLKRRFLQS